jgi:hypothetical protein
VETATAATAVKFDDKLKDEILSQVHEEKAVIVHCSYNAENISIAPEWTYVPEGKSYRFTLIFAPLPKSCEFFDLLEDIPQAGGFFIQNIKRNKSDVYHVKIT